MDARRDVQPAGHQREASKLRLSNPDRRSDQFGHGPWEPLPAPSLCHLESPNVGVAASPFATDDDIVHAKPDLYCIRIHGRLGATALSAFPAMVHHVDGRDTVLTGLLQDRSAVFGVLAQVEALGLELVELRQIRPQR